MWREECAEVARCVREVYAGVIEQVYSSRVGAIERAIADALQRGGDWQAFAAAVVAHLAGTARPIVRVERVAADGQGAVALDQRPTSQPPHGDDRVRITIDLPQGWCSATDVNDAWREAMQSQAVVQALHDDGITVTYMDDLDLYSSYYHWTWIEGKGINAFVRAIQAGQIRAPQWDGPGDREGAQTLSEDTIKRALTRARRRFEPRFEEA